MTVAKLKITQTRSQIGQTERHRGTLRALGLGKTASQVALAWAATQPAVTSPIFGARTLEQLEDNLGAADLVLPEEARKRLDEASALELVYPYDFHARVRGMMAALQLT
jgi:aryl-alcohol dehydrogenase-like predicted oxidoreductase